MKTFSVTFEEFFSDEITRDTILVKINSFSSEIGNLNFFSTVREGYAKYNLKHLLL